MLVREIYCQFDETGKTDPDFGQKYSVTVEAPWLMEPVVFPWIMKKEIEFLEPPYRSAREKWRLSDKRLRLLSSLLFYDEENAKSGMGSVVRGMQEEQLERKGFPHIVETWRRAGDIIARIFGDKKHLLMLNLGGKGPGWAIAKSPKGDEIFYAYVDGQLAAMFPVRENHILIEKNARFSEEIRKTANAGDEVAFLSLLQEYFLNPEEAEVQLQWLASSGRLRGIRIVATDILEPEETDCLGASFAPA